MTQLGWKTLAAALLLAAGFAQAQQPPAAPCPGCSGLNGSICPVLNERNFCTAAKTGCCGNTPKAGTCLGAAIGAVTGGCCAGAESCCSGCCKSGSCCSKGDTKAAGCPCCANGCCSKADAKTNTCSCSDGGCCGKADKGCCCAEASGCACCAKKNVKAAAACPCCGQSCACGQAEVPAKATRTVTVIVLPHLPGPFAFPPPPVCFAEPVPPPFYNGQPVPPPPTMAAPPMDLAYGCPPPSPLPPPHVGAPLLVEPVPPGMRVVTPAAPPVPAMACAISQPCRTESPGCNVRVVTEDGADCLEIHGHGDARMTCDHLALNIPGHKSVKLAIAGKQIAVSSPGVQARADRIAVQEAEDRLVLEGHVRLEYRCSDEEHGEVTAERIVLNLTKGQLEIKPGAGSPNGAHTTAPTPSSFQGAFSAWMGMCH